MNTKIFAATVLLAAVASANAVKLMDQMDITTGYIAGNGNHEGGDAIFGSQFDLRCADDFVVSGGPYTLTSVKVGSVGFGGTDSSAHVRIYADANGLPGDEIFAGTFAVETVGFNDTVFGLIGGIHTADVSSMGWSLGPGHYWVNMQTISATDWQYTVRNDRVTGYDSVLGDGPNGNGGYGFGLWQSAGNAGFGAGDSAMEVNGELVPEPATMIALGLGAAAMIRRRRK